MTQSGGLPQDTEHWFGPCGKRTYRSRHKARQAHKTMRNKFRVYRCDLCDGHHVTNEESWKAGDRKRRIRYRRQLSADRRAQDATQIAEVLSDILRQLRTSELLPSEQVDAWLSRLEPDEADADADDEG